MSQVRLELVLQKLAIDMEFLVPIESNWSLQLLGFNIVIGLINAE